jgi:hypothetical protein
MAKGVEGTMGGAIADSMVYIFAGAMIIVALSLVSIFFIPVIPLRGRGPPDAVREVEKAVEDAAPGAPVTTDVAEPAAKPAS